MSKKLEQSLQERQDWADINMAQEDAEDFDPFEDAMSECGQLSDGTCMLAGSEHCEFECPFRD